MNELSQHAVFETASKIKDKGLSNSEKKNCNQINLN